MGLFQHILKGEETRMMRSVFLLTFVLGLSYGSPDTLKKIEDHLKTWNCDVACWGERNVVKHKQMETEMIEKCMLQPVNPLMVGQSQAIPKKTTSHGCLWSFETISFYSSKLSPSIHLQPWICSVPTQSWQERCRRLAGVHG